MLATHPSLAPLRGKSAMIAAVIAIPLLFAHAAATNARNRVWFNGTTLWADVVEKSPGNGRGLMNYGLTHMAEGRYAEANDLFLRAYALLPNYPTLHVNLGIVTNALGDTASAERWFTRALELNPAYVGGHFFYARWLVERGRAREAIPHLQRALELSPAELNARHMLIELYAAAEDSRLAPLVQETLGYASNDSVALAYSSPSVRAVGSADTWFDRGLAATQQGRHAAAAHAYRMAASLDPARGDAWNNLGLALLELGFTNEAARAFERSIALDPSDERPRRNLALLRQRAGSR
jgi:tetratricopeptide (TPR) repeat protein